MGVGVDCKAEAVARHESCTCATAALEAAVVVGVVVVAAAAVAASEECVTADRCTKAASGVFRPNLSFRTSHVSGNRKSIRSNRRRDQAYRLIERSTARPRVCDFEKII